MQITVKEFSPPPLRRGEVLRYAGGACADRATDELIDLCAAELLPSLTYKVCFCELPVSVSENTVSICGSTTISKSLSKYLTDCDRALVFGATVGLAPDRLIKKYARVSPSRALVHSAIGSERAESLCDLFCDEISAEYKKRGFSLSPRFSAGYGDLSLDLQKPIFDTLGLTHHVGVTLNDSMLMTPTKSVTAIIAIRPI